MESEKEDKIELPQSPREKTFFVSYLFFWWVYPFFFKGSKKELGFEDLYQPLKAHRSEYLGDRLCKEWEKELQKQKQPKGKPSMLSAILRTFGNDITILGVCLFLIDFLFRLTQPIFLGYLIEFYPSEGNKKSNQSVALAYAGGVVLCSLFQVIFFHPYMFTNLHVGMKIRIAACSMMYRKALRLTSMALGNTTAGQIVNLMSNDVQRLEQCILFPHYIWMGPLETIAVAALVYYQIGPSTFVGIVFLLLFIPIQIYLGKKQSGWRLQTALRTDERVRLMNEIIQGIQVIKMYTWEKPFSKLIEYARKSEIKMIRYVSYIRGVVLSFIMFTTRASVFLSLITYVLLCNILDAQKAFMVTAYYNVLRQTMTVYFPQGIGNLAETFVSIGRIQRFMLYDEFESIEYQKNKNYIDMKQAALVPDKKTERYCQSLQTETIESEVGSGCSEKGVRLNNVIAKWDPKMNENTLSSVNLAVKPGTLMAIVGPVGAGKSSILQTILGELVVESGTVEVNGKISYACQEPWLFAASIQQNILFGLPMDKDRYRNTVKICALERDFTLFPFGDKTIVGERGQSLSGGQKARVNLARAIYRESDIYLLDDPLSAVDAHVGRHLFDKCIRRHLNNKAVILITHQLQYLQDVDQIVYIDHGRIEAVGTYENLMQSGLDFTKLLAEQEESKKKEEEESKIKRNSSALRSGRKSNSSAGSDDLPLDEAPNQMKVEESKQTGDIGFYVYRKYFSAGGGIGPFIGILMLFVLAQFFASAGDWWLNYWVDKVSDDEGTFFQPELRDGFWHDVGQGFVNFYNDPNFDIYIFTIITILTIVLSLGRSFAFFNVAMKASVNLHNTMFYGVSRARMYFFHTNPSGRILNRFSKDQGQTDELLPATMIDVLQTCLTLLGIVIIVCIVNPWFLIPTVILVVIFYFLRKYYLLTSLDVKRIEALMRSPVYGHLATSLNGLSTIRAFNAEEALIKEFDNHQNAHSSAFYMFLATSRCFGHWLDAWCVIYIIVITFSFFIFTGTSTGADVGLAITQALGMTGMVQWGMRQSAEMENNMTSVERIIEYHSVDPEPALESAPDVKPSESWPENGKVTFNNLFMRYFPDPEAEFVLRGLNFTIEPREKIGIVGRTGAGKSSLINALFRLSYNEGLIEIDGRDTEPLGLHDLRSKISIIPQEPVLFSGTLRYNLDPFDEFSDDKLWKALEEVKLKEVASEMPAGLQSRISEGGSNFSVGQRQLVCLARAILRENKILLMDEATANVDAQTDSLIQETIRTKFADCTVLTIAHRLNTVMDSDKVLVMDAGQCVEFAPPYELLRKNKGPRIFHGMVMKTGKANYEMMYQIAEKAFKKRIQAKINSLNLGIVKSRQSNEYF